MNRYADSPSLATISTRTITVAVIGLFVVWPAGRLVASAFDATAAGQVFGSTRIWRIIWFTIGQATLSTVVTLLAAVPGAWLIGRHRFRGKRLLVAFWSAPFALPAVVIGAALLALLPERVERSLFSIVFAHVLFNVGMVARVLGDAWERTDERIEHAASTLGATPTRRNLMMLRILAPEAASLAGLVMALCLTSFAIISTLGGPRLGSVETEIHRQTFQTLRIDRAAVLALVQLILVSGALVVTTRQPSGASQQHRTLLRMPRFAGPIILCALTIFTALPVVVLAERATRWPRTDGSLRSFDGFTALFHPTRGSGLLGAPINALATSARSASMATVLAVLLALIAVAASRGSQVIGAITTLPLAVSGVTLGLGTLLAFASAPVAWRSKWWMVPLTQAMVAFPFALRVLRPAVDGIDGRLRDAAATLGASPRQVLLRVVLPLVRAPLCAAAALAGAVALGEFGATSFLVRERSETIPVAISVLTSRPGDRLQTQAAALCVILAVMTMTLTATAGLAGRRR